MKTNRISILVLLCVALGCGKETSTAPDAVATKIIAASPVFVTGTVASPVTERPSVIVLDQNGNPLHGVSVSFVQTSGTATVTGTEAVTDASGRATLGEWILSKKAGQSGVTARAGPLNISFYATGIAGPAASLAKAGGDDQFALPGATLTTPQSVVVRDIYDNPAVGTLVTFVVSSGGGAISAGSATSDATGIAAIHGWKLGPTGVQSLTALVDGVASVTFTANVVEDPCTPISLSPGASGTLVDVASFGCALSDGRRANLYAINVGAGGYEFNTQSETFNGVVTIGSTSGAPVAEASAGPGANSQLRAFLNAGKYIVSVVSSSAAQSGTYRISFKESSGTQTGCGDTYLSIGVLVSQILELGDCEPSHYMFADRYRVFLQAGDQITVTMASVEVDNVIEISDPSGSNITSTNVSYSDGGAYVARIGFTAAQSGYYLVVATTAYFSGSYTLILQHPPG